MSLSTGAGARVETTVTDADTAEALGSGEVRVLGTPRVLALCEEATVAALRGRLKPGETTVGVRVQLEHISPSKVGAVVTADAHLEKAEGRRLTFNVSASDERGLIAVGKVTRVVVEVARFMEKAD